MPKVANKISSEVGCISSVHIAGLYGVIHSEWGVQIKLFLTRNRGLYLSFKTVH